MKKKLVTGALLLAFGATAITGGTLAYFTDTDEAENVFTFGNVDIIQRENQRTIDGWTVIGDGAPVSDIGTIETFEDNKNVFPAVLDKLTKEAVSVNGYDFKIRSLKGNYVDKIVNVYNNGSEEAYMRTIIAIPSMNGYDDSADATENPLHWNYLDSTDFNNVGWDWNGSNDAEATEQKCYAQDVMIDGVAYDLYVATHNKAVAAKSWTAPSMVGFYLDDDVNCDENGYFSMQNGKRIDLSNWMVPGADGKVSMKILVATQACQTAGFDNAWEALDECFEPITADNHPWAE